MIQPLFIHIIRPQPGCTESIVYYIYFILLCVEFLLHCFIEQITEHGYQRSAKVKLLCVKGMGSHIPQTLCIDWCKKVGIK